MDHDDGVDSNGGQSAKPLINLITLPAELLVHILSFLPMTRDIVMLRYVSRRFWSICEIPSLWRQFVWPHFHAREERCVENVLESFFSRSRDALQDKHFVRIL